MITLSQTLTEQKGIPLNDNIVANTPESSKVEAFHIKCPEIPRHETF